MSWDRPIPFAGPPEQAAANRRTHHWMQPDREEVPECDECGSKSWHAAANYPCGADVPREVIEIPPRNVPVRSAPPDRRDLD